ncbi:neutral/alkaline non-lysosomal ceramidase N-terminal domain-containing protein [Hyphomonas sp. CACIAM 19H1]|uniref:neutral/alkaline non-lysosomal ceramidase N-terminal domain-containing protein n=1 Tax=Hyphomonas sp. CACIAM 19H1 TaxID=1873716 RepID=UPI001F398C89|nr:neutral/alkaline non-lysosomal ceramidase N-terminal domain-containing protein [Hyphomonas sp. CACIAM 19H1]
MTKISSSVFALRSAVAAISIAAGFSPLSASLAQEAVLKAGASKVDITPSGDKLPGIFTGILDPIHVRAIVLENGAQRAALVTVDAGAIPNEIWQRLTTKAEAELGIPANQVILTATHTHSVPFGWSVGYEEQLYQAVEEAAAALQPAKMASGTGVSYINVNRNIIDPATGRWWEGPNYQGPSDKTVAVLSFQSLDGAPIAVYYNYAVHPVITGNLDLISGDIPGAASGYIEESLGEDAVAVFSYGAAGDQNPIFFQQTYDLREIRIADFAARGEDISNAMPPGGQGMDRSNPKVAMLMEQQKQMNATLGQMLGEEVLHVLRSGLARPVTQASISGAQMTVSCPGRNRLDKGRAGYAGVYEDADSVPMKLSLLRIGDTVIGGIDAEIFTMIAQRFKAESPIKNSIVATLTNGMSRSGYIPNDAAFAQNTFEVVSSRVKPGCAETAIVNGFLDLIEDTGTSAD